MWVPEVDSLALDEVHKALAVALQANGDLKVGRVVVQFGSETNMALLEHIIGTQD